MMVNSTQIFTKKVNLFSDKVFCANCIHCKLVRVNLGGSSQYNLRVRCNAGNWKKKLGEEKLYKYFTVARRSFENCNQYGPMGDAMDYMRDLKKDLPIKDETYTY